MKVKFKKYHESAQLPWKAYDGDFCYDLVAVSEDEVAPDVWKYGFGFGLQIERGDELLIKNEIDIFGTKTWTGATFDMSKCPLNLSIDIRPRSSIWKTGMVLSNSTGTVDEGYTNEISAVFYHINKSLPRYKVGDRVAQMKVGFTMQCEFIEVTEFNETERGMNGYGSTNK